MKILYLTQRVFKHELISGASVIFFGSLLTSILNFLFNLYMRRSLSDTDYGVLASLVSLVTLASLPAGAAVPMIVHFGASYFAKGEIDLVYGLFLKVLKASLIFAAAIFLLAIVFINQIQTFLQLHDSTLIIISAVIIFFSIIQVVNIALLQAKLSFTFIAFINFLGAFLKLALGLFFVFAQFAVRGAMFAYLISGTIPYILSFWPLGFIFKKGIKTKNIRIGSLFGYAAPSATALFSLTSFITTDILLVKHFFNPQEAGIYATLSLIGRVIFFFSGPISIVMFPLVVQKHAREENFHTIFKLSLLLVLLPSVALTIFYFLFPEFVISLFSNKESVPLISPYLGVFGIFIAIYSLLSVLVNFFLSIKKTKVFIPVIICAILQTIGIWIFHDTFWHVIISSLISASLLLILLLLYYWKLYGKKTN